MTSSDLFRRAQELIPGGVNSPVRAMRAVGLDSPLFVERGEGAYLYDVDGKRYLDWVLSWGPLLFGHADTETVEAVRAAALRGTTFGASTEAEVELAAEIVDAVPSVEKVRLVSSGTEAAMSALRLARGFTKRDRILKFAGCYHGHSDALLASAGSGLATLGIPSSPGVPTAVTQDTIVCPYNDVDFLAEAVMRYGEGLAAIIVEPVAGNMGVVPPAPGILEALRRLRDPKVYDELERKAARLADGIERGTVNRVGAMLTIFATDEPPRNFEEAQQADVERYAQGFRHLLENGVYVAPSQFEAMFVSLAHSDEDIDRTIAVLNE